MQWIIQYFEDVNYSLNYLYIYKISIKIAIDFRITLQASSKCIQKNEEQK